jgi:hypothetical protein
MINEHSNGKIDMKEFEILNEKKEKMKIFKNKLNGNYSELCYPENEDYLLLNKKNIIKNDLGEIDKNKSNKKAQYKDDLNMKENQKLKNDTNKKNNNHKKEIVNNIKDNKDKKKEDIKNDINYIKENKDKKKEGLNKLNDVLNQKNKEQKKEVIKNLKENKEKKKEDIKNDINNDLKDNKDNKKEGLNKLNDIINKKNNEDKKEVIKNIKENKEKKKEYLKNDINNDLKDNKDNKKEGLNKLNDILNKKNKEYKKEVIKNLKENKTEKDSEININSNNLALNLPVPLMNNIYSSNIPELQKPETIYQSGKLRGGKTNMNIINEDNQNLIGNNKSQENKNELINIPFEDHETKNILLIKEKINSFINHHNHNDTFNLMKCFKKWKLYIKKPKTFLGKKDNKIRLRNRIYYDKPVDKTLPIKNREKHQTIIIPTNNTKKEKIYEPIIDNTYSQNNNKDNKKDNINERDMIEDKNKNIKINNNEIPNDKKKKGNVVTIKYNKDRRNIVIHKKDIKNEGKNKINEGLNKLNDIINKKTLDDKKETMNILKNYQNKNKLNEGLNSLNNIINEKNLKDKKEILDNLKKLNEAEKNNNIENLNKLNDIIIKNNKNDEKKGFDNINNEELKFKSKNIKIKKEEEKYDSCGNDKRLMQGWLFVKIISYISYQQKCRIIKKYFEKWGKNIGLKKKNKINFNNPEKSSQIKI